MAFLYGREWKKEELLNSVGRPEALADIRLSELSDGPGRNVRVADIHTGSGLFFTVLLDRGMDIGPARYRGIPLSFFSSTGIRSPYFYESRGYGWQKNFHGGLLTLCGLSAAGHPSIDERFGEHGLHGRVSNTPAENVNVYKEWKNDEFELSITGEVREAWVFGFNLVMRRKIIVRLGQSVISVQDEFENLDTDEAPLMLLYHCNFGFPIVSEGSSFLVNDRKIEARDETAQQGLDRYDKVEAPQAGYEEQVFYHDPEEDKNGYAECSLRNLSIDHGKQLETYVKYRKKELPELLEWKQMGVKDYAFGMEPANCRPEGRAEELEKGRLKIIKSGEIVRTAIEIGIRNERS